ncbi:MAG: protein-disulfide reductase DsbD domain-containing protein, partial [Chromatiaceae bacterium]
FQGGYGAAPKFPREPQLQLLLDQAVRARNAASEAAALLTLRSMAQGGIHDQVGGGFHRYAIDNDWLVPHFEKMLYNQAQLARLYAAAWRLTGEPGLARVARRALAFVLRDLTSPEGVFYSATDAESEGEEGRFYLWTPGEIRAVLPGEAADLAIRLFGVTEAGNFEGRNILHLPSPPEALAKASGGLALPDLLQRMDSITAALETARSIRPRPHRDEKVLTGWNGLMVTALAEAGDTLEEPRYLAAAERAAQLLWSRARDADGTLQRVYLDGRASVPALQEDYAFLGEGMIALYDVTGEARWLERARALADAMWTRFADPSGGGLYMAEPDHTPQMARPKDLADGPMPSGHSAALSLLAGLTRRTEEPVYAERARGLVAAVSGQVARDPEAFPSLLVALDRLRLGETGPRQYAAQGAVRVHARARPAQDGTRSLPAPGRLSIEIDMRPGWHINAHRPLQDELIGTTLTGGGGRGWRLGDVRYPHPQVLSLGFSREPLALYQGEVRIEASYEAEQGAGVAGPSPPIPLKLRLQACSERFCRAPEELSLEVPTAAP